MKVFKFDGQEFKDEQSLRFIIWRKKSLILPKDMSVDAWLEVGVQVEDVEVGITKEMLAKQVRAKRDRLLSACDYYLMPDYPSTEEGLAEVKAYRQALRDISKQDGFPNEVVFPEIPTVLG